MSPEDFKRLKHMRLFAGLSGEELETIAVRGVVRNLRKNTVFIERGDSSSTLYLILSGKVKVYVPDGQENEQVLAIRGPGDHLGELALYHRRVTQEEAVVIPILLTNPAAEELKQHFHRRGEVAPSRGATKYLENFSAIWQIQDHLIGEAQRCGVSTIPNADLDDTLHRVIGVITEHLVERFR